MPENLGIGFFVLGAVLILIALVGGRFKIFIAEISPAVTSPLIRFMAFALGVVFILLSLNPTIVTTAWTQSASTESPVTLESPQWIPPDTPTSLPLTEPSQTPTVPSLTPTPTGPDPAEFVASYWQNVNDGNLTASWAQLSPGFQQAKHMGDYNNYVRGYQQMSLCRIVVSNIHVVQQESYFAVLRAHFSYYTGTQCTPSEYDFEMWLIYDVVNNAWLFDKNIIRS